MIITRTNVGSPRRLLARQQAAGPGWRACIFCLVLAAGAVCAELPDKEFVNHVDERIESGDYVGMIVGLIDGEDSYVQAFGTISRESNSPPDERTIFEISSVSKTFAATLLAQSVTGGAVKLEDSANRYLEPDARLSSYDGTDITLLDLAAHQSGLPYLPEDLPPGDLPNPNAHTTRSDLFKAIDAFTPTSSPGQGYSYSAFAYGVLALVLERVHGEEFFTLVERDVTAPLGMQDTVLSLNDDQATRLATGYTPEGEESVPLDQGVFRAAGSMYSSLHDLMLWLRANMNPEQSPMTDALNLAQEIHNELGTIGLTWHRTEGYDERSQFGTANGYRVYVGFLADGSKGVVVMANTRPDIEALGNRLLLGTDLPE